MVIMNAVLLYGAHKIDREKHFVTKTSIIY